MLPAKQPKFGLGEATEIWAVQRRMKIFDEKY